MDKAVLISYASALILLYLCILLFNWDNKRRDHVVEKLLMVFGMIPGFIGVLYGFYSFLTMENRARGLAIMTAWLLLELGAVQLRQFSKSLNQ